MIIASKPKKTDGRATNITMRGVTPEAFNVRNGIKLVEGRMFEPGLFEVIVGKKISDRVKGLNIGDTIRVQRKDFKVVGLFTADGSSFESEMWGDYNAMGPGGGPQWRLRVAHRSPDESRRCCRASTKTCVPIRRCRYRLTRSARITRTRPGGVGCRFEDPGGVRRHRDGHRRGVWRDEHYVCHRVAAHARNRHIARPGLLALQHADCRS